MDKHTHGQLTHTCTHKHTHTQRHIDGTALGPERDNDSCVIISSTPPFSNKLLLLFSLSSPPPVKLLISAATRGDDKSLHCRDERSSTKNSKPSLSLSYFQTHTHRQPSSILSSSVLHLLHSSNANSPLSHYENKSI